MPMAETESKSVSPLLCGTEQSCEETSYLSIKRDRKSRRSGSEAAFRYVRKQKMPAGKPSGESSHEGINEGAPKLRDLCATRISA